MSGLVAFTDEDHVTGLVHDLLARRDDAVAAFFTPEIVDAAALRELRAGLDVRTSRSTAGADVLVLRRGPVTRDLIESTPTLRLIQRLGERSTGIDLPAAREHGVAVSCLPRPSLVRTAEHTMLLLLAVVRRLLDADRAVRQAPPAPGGPVAYNWAGLRDLGGLDGRTLGIVGMGEVGHLVARRAAAFGMTVLHTGTTALPDLLGRSDVVTLHTSGHDNREPVLGRAEIAAMRPGAVLVNTGRGWLVDEDALREALSTGRLGGAGLDVHRTEPRAVDDPMLALPNVVLTPHVAGGSRLDVLHEVGRLLDNVRDALAGRPPRHGLVLP